MFGQVDWQGKMVSFFVRLGNVVFRSIGMFFWCIMVSALFLCWVLLPIGIAYMAIISWATI
jgi:hypothetical protein